MCEHLSTIHLEQHTVEMALHDDAFEVSIVFQGITQLASPRVLQHERTVLIVQIGQGESTLWQHVEELFLGIAVVGHGLVVIQVVMRQVGEDATSKMQPSNAILSHTVGTHLHKGVLTIFIHHLLQQSVQLDRVRSGVCRRNNLTVDNILNRREQTTIVARLGKESI